MQDLLVSWFGTTGATFARLALAVVVVLALLLALRWILERTRAGGSIPFTRNRQQRLAVLDVTAVDARRRLVLVRRDNVEHLLLIGGPTDIVVEQTIYRGVPVGSLARAPVAPAPPAAPPQDAQAPAPQAPQAPLAPPVVPMPEPVQRARSIEPTVVPIPVAPPVAATPPPEPAPPVEPQPKAEVRPFPPAVRQNRDVRPVRRPDDAPTRSVPPAEAYVPPVAVRPQPHPDAIAPIVTDPAPLAGKPEAPAEPPIGFDDLARRLDEALRVDLEPPPPEDIRAEAPRVEPVVTASPAIVADPPMAPEPVARPEPSPPAAPTPRSEPPVRAEQVPPRMGRATPTEAPVRPAPAPRVEPVAAPAQPPVAETAPIVRPAIGTTADERAKAALGAAAAWFRPRGLEPKAPAAAGKPTPAEPPAPPAVVSPARLDPTPPAAATPAADTPAPEPAEAEAPVVAPKAAETAPPRATDGPPSLSATLAIDLARILEADVTGDVEPAPAAPAPAPVPETPRIAADGPSPTVPPEPAPPVAATAAVPTPPATPAPIVRPAPPRPADVRPAVPAGEPSRPAAAPTAPAAPVRPAARPMPGTAREMPLREPTTVVVEPPKPAPPPVDPPAKPVVSPTTSGDAAPGKEADFSSLEDEMARLLDELAGDLKADKPT